MTKKLLLCLTLFSSVFIVSAQDLTNLVFDSEILPTATTVDITFDYSGVSAGDVFEWQLFLALPDGSPDWSSGRNIAYEGNITPDVVGSGTQTTTLNVFNTPVDGEVFTWVGKITLGSDGSDTGYNNTGNLVTISSTASVTEFLGSNAISIYPNPVENALNINTKGSEIESIAILDLTGRVVLKNISATETIDVSTLKQGVYFLRTNDKRTVKFLKK